MLEAYREKRNFAKTTEPQGRRTAGGGGARTFVIQKHHASRLHYDLRLEVGGVLVSWAVPKGPSTDPRDRRLAVKVEDHPLEYAEFEGVIPKGQYGAGRVLLWDRGTWQPEEQTDPAESLAKGTLKFILHGEKLKGSWALVRMNDRNDGENWLLIKHRDSHAATTSDEPVVDAHPSSVKTGRTIEQIAAPSGRAGSKGARRGSGRSNGATRSATDFLAKPRPGPPSGWKPELATLSDTAPTGEDWIHEVKYDGYRILAVKEGDRVALWSRNAKEWTHRFESVARALRSLEGDAVLDGEVVVLDQQGVSSFQALQRSLKGAGEADLVYCAFDLLSHNGEDLRGASLLDRKDALSTLLTGLEGEVGGRIRYSEHQRGEGPAFHRAACQNGLEGIISKRIASPYRGRRTRDWLKLKCSRRQEFVIVGFSAPSGSRKGFGALLLGVHDAGGKLRYAGRVGTGFDDATLRSLRASLDTRARTSPAVLDPPEGSEVREVTWVGPDLVAEVAFTEWTEDGRLRHPSFQGLREDKTASEVRREAVAGEATTGRVKNDPSRPKRPGTKLARRAAPVQDGIMKVAGITITSAERPVFPSAGISKGEVAEYYAAVAPHLLPHLVGRPLSVVRCPEGRSGTCFYQKHRAAGMPSAIGSLRVTEKNGSDEYLTVKTVAGVVALVQFGVLEIHPWLSRSDRIERPDAMVFDLDPGQDVDWEEVLGAAYLLRDLLHGFDLESFPKLTGGKGLHVVAPLIRRHDFAVVKAAAKAVAEQVRDHNPDKFVTVATKAKRNGKIYLDYLRNGRGATAVAPFSVRAREGAPVAVPVSWEEVRPGLRPDQYSINTLLRRLASLKRDPWEGFFEIKQSLKSAVLRELGVS